LAQVGGNRPGVRCSSAAGGNGSGFQCRGTAQAIGSEGIAGERND